MRYILALLLSFFYTQLFAFEFEYQFKQYNVNNGLPSAQVYEVIQDPQGYIWFGTDRGLVKYNGYEFKVYTVEDGLSTNVIFKLDIDAQGRVCCYGKDRRFHILKNEHFVEFKYAEDLEGLISTRSNLFDFDFHKNGFAYSTFDWKENTSVFTEIDFNESVSYKREVGVYLHSNETTMLGFKIGLKNENELISLPFFYNGTAIDSIVITRSFYYFASSISNDKIIYFSLMNSLYQFSKESKEIQLIKSFEDLILDLELDKYGNLYIGFRMLGLWKWNRNSTNGFECLLPDKAVPSVCIDCDGGIWVSTLFNGVYYCGDQNNRTFISDKQPLKMAEMDSTLFIISEFEELYSINWVTSADESFHAYEAEPYERLQNYEKKPLLIDALFNIRVFFELDGDTFTSLGAGSNENVKLGEQYVQISRSSINIWDENVSWTEKVIIQTDFFLNCGEKMDDSRLILGSDVGVMLMDNSGYLRSDGNIHVHNDPINLEDYRPDIPFFRQKMRDILNCDDSVRVFASSENGLLIETNGRKNRCLLESDGLICNEIDHVYYKEGELVIITKKGISILSNTGDIKNYTNKNGLLSNNVQDAIILGDKLWVATDLGTSILQNKPNTVPDFPIYLTEVDVNLTPQPIKETIQLNFRQDLVDLSFEGLSFPLEGDIMYKYQLKGVDPIWTETPNRTVRYANLPYGEFEFWITGQKRDKTWTTPQRLITLNRVTPIWETIYFEIFIVAIFIGLTWLFFLWRFQRLQRIERDKLQVLNLERKTLQAQMNPHFIFNSLTSLQNLIVKNDTQSANEYLGKFARLTRIALQQSTQNWVKLKDELKLLEHYIELEQVRFPDHFTFEIQVKLDNLEIYVPPFLIQPFIENAILHGLANKKEGGNINIEIIQKDEKMVQFTIVDNGIGRIRSSSGIKQNRSLGIRLIKERLQLLLKINAVTIIDLIDENQNGIGTKIVVYIPYKNRLDESINN